MSSDSDDAVSVTDDLTERPPPSRYVLDLHLDSSTLLLVLSDPVTVCLSYGTCADPYPKQLSDLDPDPKSLRISDPDP